MSSANPVDAVRTPVVNTPWMGHLLQRLLRQGLRHGLSAYLAVMNRLAPGRARNRTAPDEGLELLVTGTFFSDNWIASHLRPLALSRACRRVLMVSASPLPDMEGVEAIYPPRWLSRTVGKVPTRLLTFSWVGLRRRPDVIGGFHLLLNGLLAAFLSRLTGARSLYFCGGGPREVLGGGYISPNRLFGKLDGPDEAIEERLLRAVSHIDDVITMGTGAIDFFRDRGVHTAFHVVPGGFDGERFSPAVDPPRYDLILVGRLTEVKRVDLFLEAVLRLKESLPGVTAAVLGDGPLRNDLERLAADLGVDENVDFLGQHGQVEHWLKQARLFVLTSDSEGLSLAMMEAMLCGLPPVVSDVGDLGDMVEDGVNGNLVPTRTPEAFASCFKTILTDPDRLARFSEAARRSAGRYAVENTARLWDGILADPVGISPQRRRGLGGRREK